MNTCSENQVVLNSWQTTINNLNDTTTIPTIDDVKGILWPLLESFNIDGANVDGQGPECQGYTDQVRDAVESYIKNRADVLIPILQQICQEQYNGKDVDYMQALAQAQAGAKAALILLNQPTNTNPGTWGQGTFGQVLQ